MRRTNARQRGRFPQSSQESVRDTLQLHQQVPSTYIHPCPIRIPLSPLTQVSIHETDDTREPEYLMVMKGAPERILERCKTILNKGKEIPLDERQKKKNKKTKQKHKRKNERVLGFCDMKVGILLLFEYSYT